MDVSPNSAKTWTFLTTHGNVLLYLALHPEARIRDVAAAIGITERSAQGTISDLVADGYLERERVGRRNRYRIRSDAGLRHPLWQDGKVSDILRALAGTALAA